MAYPQQKLLIGEQTRARYIKKKKSAAAHTKI